MAVQVPSLKRDADAPRWRWYHGLAFLVVVQISVFALQALVAWLAGYPDAMSPASENQQQYVFGLRQAAFTPPGWAFGPVWITNNILTIIGTLIVLNKPHETPGRRRFLRLQAASWLIFVSFNALFFGLRSPIHAFVLTFGMWLLTVASISVAVRQIKDNRVAWLLSTLLVWTTLASAVAFCQMLWNPDLFYGVGPFTEPPAWLLR